jgi:transcriptional regulator with XRE-family HTH domain
MSIVEFAATTESPPVACAPPPRRALHRIRQVRIQQGVSLRAVARRIRGEVSQLRQQEREDADLSLGDLYKWQQALGVPVQDLLVECEEPLSAPVLQLSRMIRLAKTVATIQERSENTSVNRLADMLMGQLVEIMPELSEVGPWPSTRPRTLDDLGRVVERRLSEEAFRSLDS